MPRGGPRPNGGRPSKKDIQYQANMRQLVQEVITPEDWRRVIEVRLAYAKAGNADAFRDLEKWVMGKVPEVVNHTTDPDAPMRVEVVYTDDQERAA